MCRYLSEIKMLAVFHLLGVTKERVDIRKQTTYLSFYAQGRDRIVVSTLRCGRNNPGSNPGHGTCLFQDFFYSRCCTNLPEHPVAFPWQC